MIDVTTLIWSILGFSVLNLAIGYGIGHFGLAAIKSDITSIKDLLSGQAKVAVVTTPVETPVVTATVPTA